jgi:phosphoglycolate/pyridoxal phosphate phosphatase family enzyme
MIFDGLVCDMDGVLYRGDAPIEGAAAAVDEMRRRGVRLVFCTNNSRSTVGQYIDKLARMGIRASPQEIVTSAVVTAEVLARRSLKDARAIVVGGDGIRTELSSIGIEIDDGPESTEADLVVVGWDPRFDYSAMRRAAAAVMSGAEFVATNDDSAFPAPDGLWPGAGAILASIETASGRRAEVMGKPHDPMMETVAVRLDGAQEVAMVGDRPETDLAGGASRGWATVLVLTGVTGRDEAARVTPSPDLVVDSLQELLGS